jgi:hypothetical protein
MTKQTPSETNSSITPIPAVEVMAPEDSKTTALKPSSRRGRIPPFKRPSTNRDLFPDGKPDPLASNEVIWEGCNLLSQGRDARWVETGRESPYYESSVAKGKGYLSFWITGDLHGKDPTVLEQEAALALIDQFDIRAACLHLIYAAYATQLDRPWEQHFVVSDRQLEAYLGLDKNKKLNKQQKLFLLLELAKQPCHLLVYVSSADGGKAKSFSISRTWLWEISEPILHFQENLMGNPNWWGLLSRSGQAIGLSIFSIPLRQETDTTNTEHCLKRSCTI